MARGGPPTYTYAVPTGTVAVSGATISSAAYNNFLSDLTTVLNSAWPINLGGTGTTDGSSSWPNGTAGAPAAAFINSATSGFYRVSADKIGVSIAGVVKFDFSVSGQAFYGATSGTITVVPTAIAGSSVLTLPAATDTLVGKATTDTLTNKTLTAPILSAGTTSVQPITFTSGTLNTTAVAGVMEYDGTAPYFTSVASSRQVVAAQQFAVTTTANALSNSSTAAQNIFPSANDVLTVAASTTYFFEAVIYETTGATSHTVAFGLGGTASFTSVGYSSICRGITTADYTGAAFVTTASATVISIAITATAFIAILRGTIRINAGGTISPQITHSAGPTGTCQIEPNSYFRLWPVGSNTVAAVGNWG